MDAKAIADRYISRGGGKPVPTRQEVAADVSAVASFIAWHDGNDMWGGHKAGEAFDALCRLLNIDRIELRRAVLGVARFAPPDPGPRGGDDDDLPF